MTTSADPFESSRIGLIAKWGDDSSRFLEIKADSIMLYSS